MDSNTTHNDFHQQPNSGLLRFRSAPSSLLVNFTENGNFGVNKTNIFEDSESEKLFSRFGYSGNTDSDSSSQNFRDFDDKSMVTGLNTQQRYSGLPPHYPRHSLSSSASGLENSSFGLMGSMGLDHNSHTKAANSNLVRQSSSPVGLFSNLSVQNGYATIKGVSNYNGPNGIDHEEASPSPSSKRLKGQIGFSSGLSSLEILSQIPEIENESLLDEEKLENGFPYGSWGHSSNNVIKRYSGSPRNQEIVRKSPSTKNEEFGNDQVHMLSHHLSLPKASVEGTMEKFLYFQDSVPCKIRAKRGFATHPRSIAERVRRTRISERMRKLQDLVPNMDKQTNTADMLDLAVEYIKDLQEQYKSLNDIRAKCKCLRMQKAVQNQTRDLYKNKLSGEIPQVVEALNLSDVDLSENNFTGKIPKGFGNLTKLIGLTLFLNNLHGDIPMEIGRLTELQYFNLFSNNLSGIIPPDLGKYSMLREFQVSSNRLQGNLPEHLCSRGNLVGVVAFDNSLNGELPKSLENCSGLIIVNVKNNNFYGNVPSGLWASFNLTDLTLSDNSFTGELPEKLAWNISRLEISNNKFSGKIPNGVFSWKRLVVFEASNNLFTGPVPQELTDLSSLTRLLLDRNKLEGSFPSNIISWKSLNTLNLSQNNLFGSLPEKLGLLPGLTDLDLSFNKFSGKIPSQFGSLRPIILNLSSNNLTGIIPKAFENAAYANSFLNNPGLCANSQKVNLNICNLKNLKAKNISPEFLAIIISCSAAIFLLTLLLSI